jgi:hypothetical protein
MLAYFDCFSGISGDMTLGAFIDLGVPADWLRERLASIPLPGFDLSAETVYRHGIGGKRVVIRAEETSHHRHHADIVSMIERSRFSDAVKRTSLEIFDRIAEAEAGIHGCPKEKVHFHEVGAIDAIADIVGTALCVEYLGIKEVRASRIPLGGGFVTAGHGTLPLPAPATLAILKNVPVYGVEITKELVTPTGAAIVVTLAESFGRMPEMKVEKIGYGAGARDLEAGPNLLRICLGSATNTKSGILKDAPVLVETCIDDMNPEIFGFLMERLFEDGALDVYWIPIFMKKNRPGIQVQVLCTEDRRKAVIERIFSETTTLGVRHYPVERSMLRREEATIQTRYGEIRVKRVFGPGEKVRIVPEFEVCRQIARTHGDPIREVYDTILKEAGR